MINRILFSLVICIILISNLNSQDHSVARTWNEEILNAIRNDFARPTVHARNLWHTSVAMYDIWALHDSIAKPYFLGNNIDGFEFAFDGIPPSDQVKEDTEEAISFAIYRIMFNRFISSPGAGNIIGSITQRMNERGYNVNNQSRDYQSGDPAALGNYIADKIIEFGYQDNSNQQGDYANLFYEPINEPLVIIRPGSGDIVNLNRWQPLTLDVFIDQSGNEIPGATPEFLSPEWGNVKAFALSQDDLNIYTRDGDEYYVYHDPGNPPYISETEINETSEEYKWGFALVSVWSSHLDTSDQVVIDISPASFGNNTQLPQSIAEYRDYYNLFDGGSIRNGHDVNPNTMQPYEPNIVKRGDYARVLAEFWADGPDSETPPGHWFTLLNYINDHELFERKYRGQGEKMDALEWDVKAYMMLGGAMHDCAVTAWGIKGYYDYIRPVSAIRGMASKGQSSDTNLPNYHHAGLPLIDGYIELISENDPLVGNNMENLNKIKLYAWRGPDFINNPDSDQAGVGWILAEYWWPYQRPSFVTPPFAGYVSGHSTFSRAAAELLSTITGDEFFPGGMGEFVAKKNEFLVFEDGPSEDVVLQWATYRDASDQTSLSRIWGGIHPPADDIPGRRIGIDIAFDVVELAEQYFFKDEDQDGFYNYIDCDDLNAQSYPNAPEICDGEDNNCDGFIDNGLPLFTYYFDGDQDGFGDLTMAVDTCLSIAPTGYVSNKLDCDDSNNQINPDVAEVCDGMDNDCSGAADDGLPKNRYYLDNDQDGFGNLTITADTCLTVPPIGYVSNKLDCDDSNNQINPDVAEVCDGIDNDCSGAADDGLPKNRYYLDNDQDGFGNEDVFIDTCLMIAPIAYVDNFSDCNDSDQGINPSVTDIADNGIDEDCSGVDLYKLSKVFPNPFTDEIRIHLDYSGEMELSVYSRTGQLVSNLKLLPQENSFRLNLSKLSPGVYYFRIEDSSKEELYADTIIKL